MFEWKARVGIRSQSGVTDRLDAQDSHHEHMDVKHTSVNASLTFGVQLVV